MKDAYHCSLLSNVKHEFHQSISKFDFSMPTMPVYRNVDAKLYTKANIISGLTDHFDHTVLFYKSICNAIDSFGSDSSTITFYDIGSNGYLAKCVADIEDERNEKYDIVKFDS